MGAEREIRAKYRALLPAMDERHRRLWAGTEARALGRGGIAVVARATGLARNTIVRGLAELEEKKQPYSPQLYFKCIKNMPRSKNGNLRSCQSLILELADIKMLQHQFLEEMFLLN